MRARAQAVVGRVSVKIHSGAARGASADDLPSEEGRLSPPT